ncbi:MAG: transposase [Acetobacteraceae bacterium]|nr:transposase [Acetobacteraceae bacterium]
MGTDASTIAPTAELETTRTSPRTSGRNLPVELITRGEPRRRWSLEQKQAIAAESLLPGASPIAVARCHGISSGLLYTWRRALLAAQPALTRFARVEVAAASEAARPEPDLRLPALPDPGAPSAQVEIVLSNGTIVRVDARIEPGVLRRVLSVLRG